MARKSGTFDAAKAATRLTHLGRPTSPGHPFVNPPVVRASTVLFEDTHALHDPKARYVYGRRGTPTSEALTEVLADLEGAEGAVVLPSGLAAISVGLLSLLSAGDHLLLVDTAYKPARLFADDVLARLGIETTYYEPTIGAGIEALMRPNTKVIYLEAPGSLTFEMQDVPAITEVARRHGAYTMMDNTWATPLFFRPLDHGVDVSLMAATKYIVGHSDAMLGTLACGPRAWRKVKDTYGTMGMFTGPDDMWLALRGLRTLEVRLRHHQQAALDVARWFQGRPEVAQVLHPGLPQDPGHQLFKRDFKGSTGLFGVLLKPTTEPKVRAFLDSLSLFGLGYSWGGFESLAIPCDMTGIRTARPWMAEGPLLRFHIGLEDVGDLVADLEAGFAAMSDA